MNKHEKAVTGRHQTATVSPTFIYLQHVYKGNVIAVWIIIILY